MALRSLVSKAKQRFVDADNGFDLDLSYITDNIIAMGFPSSGREAYYRNPATEVRRFFETRHAGNYKIFNLCSERDYSAIEGVFPRCEVRPLCACLFTQTQPDDALTPSATLHPRSASRSRITTRPTWPS